MNPEPMAPEPWFDEEPFLADRSGFMHGSGGGGGSLQQHMAMPRLMGQPAYARPPRLVVEEADRPFDPDDLPLEAFRTDEERQLAASYTRNGSAGNGSGNGGALKPSSSGGLRGIAARLMGSKS
jgi:hypothetical protein